MFRNYRNELLSSNSNGDLSSFNSLSLESFHENRKYPLFVSQMNCSENKLGSPVEKVKRDMGYWQTGFT